MTIDLGTNTASIIGSQGSTGLANLSAIAYYDDINQVPEPSTLAIFALGMIGLASRRFKKQ